MLVLNVHFLDAWDIRMDVLIKTNILDMGYVEELVVSYMRRTHFVHNVGNCE